jgi:ribonuclease P protein component
MPLYKLQTIKKANAFKEIFLKGKKFSNENATAVIGYRDKDIQDHLLSQPNEIIINYAVTIGKKNAKKAVVRNRVKRLLRVSLHKILLKYEPEDYPFESIVIIWKTAPGHPALIKLKDVQPAVFSLLKRAIDYYTNKMKISNAI